MYHRLGPKDDHIPGQPLAKSLHESKTLNCPTRCRSRPETTGFLPSRLCVGLHRSFRDIHFGRCSCGLVRSSGGLVRSSGGLGRSSGGLGRSILGLVLLNCRGFFDGGDLFLDFLFTWFFDYVAETKCPLQMSYTRCRWSTVSSRLFVYASSVLLKFFNCIGFVAYKKFFSSNKRTKIHYIPVLLMNKFWWKCISISLILSGYSKFPNLKSALIVC